MIEHKILVIIIYNFFKEDIGTLSIGSFKLPLSFGYQKNILIYSGHRCCHCGWLDAASPSAVSPLGCSSVALLLLSVVPEVTELVGAAVNHHGLVSAVVRLFSL